MHELHAAAPHPGRGGFYHQKNMLEKCRIQASYGGDMLFLAADDQLLFGMRDSIPRLKTCAFRSGPSRKVMKFMRGLRQYEISPKRKNKHFGLRIENELHDKLHYGVTA